MNCEMCSGPAKAGRRFCSRTCSNRRQRPTIVKPCEQCGVNFSPKPHMLAEGKGHFCSRACYREAVARKVKNCLHCGNVIPETGWHYEALYCSQACYHTAIPGPWWKGGRVVNADGYVSIWAPDHAMARKDGYVFEHRLVVAESIGRSLDPEEVVHHINGVTGDNRSENLMLFASHSEHQSHHAMERRYA